jgi:hypothetical protein
MGRKHRARDREGLPPLWDPVRPGRVSRDYLDLLDEESGRMSAALQDPGKWPGIMAAAREAAGQISAFEAALDVDYPLAEYEQLFARCRQLSPSNTLRRTCERSSLTKNPWTTLDQPWTSPGPPENPYVPTGPGNSYKV